MIDLLWQAALRGGGRGGAGGGIFSRKPVENPANPPAGAE